MLSIYILSNDSKQLFMSIAMLFVYHWDHFNWLLSFYCLSSKKANVEKQWIKKDTALHSGAKEIDCIRYLKFGSDRCISIVDYDDVVFIFL